MSDVYNIFHPQRPAPQQPNMLGMMNNIRQFANTLQGNPEQIVRGLLSSGRMTQDQFNQLSQQASQIQQMFGLR